MLVLDINRPLQIHPIWMEFLGRLSCVVSLCSFIERVATAGEEVYNPDCSGTSKNLLLQYFLQLCGMLEKFPHCQLKLQTITHLYKNGSCLGGKAAIFVYFVNNAGGDGNTHCLKASLDRSCPVYIYTVIIRW